MSTTPSNPVQSTQPMTGEDIAAEAWRHFEIFLAKHVDELDGLSQLEIVDRYSQYCAALQSEKTT